jgi:excisionase family DNA binding protein
MCTVTSEILEPKEVAQMLKVSVRTVTRLAEKNELEGFKIGDLWRFYRSDIDAYIEAQKLKRKAKEQTK